MNLKKFLPCAPLSPIVKKKGYDFASYTLGYQYFKTKNATCESLIVMNDSCTGPHYDMTAAISKMHESKNTVYGITKSYEISEYIQSYFYHFGADLIKNGIVDAFFERIRILKTKWGIVRFLEIGSSKFLRNHKICLRALVDPADPEIARLMKEYDQTDPVTDPLGKLLVEKQKTPFYKRSNQKSIAH